MKKVVLFFAVCAALVSCSNEQKQDAQQCADSAAAVVDTVVATVVDSTAAVADSVVANTIEAAETAAEVVEAIENAVEAAK